MNLEMPIIMLYAKPYSITEGSQTNDGVTVQYIISSDLEPREDGEEKGIRVTRGSIPLTEKSSIIRCPGNYQGMFTMKTGSDGKAALKLLSVNFISDLNGEA